jgi:type VI secretion system protein ImpE
LVALRENQPEEANALLAEVEAERGETSGRYNGERSFDDIRDLDDATASFFELLTAQGTYLWLPFELVATVDFAPPKRPRDLLWRPAHFELQDGPSLDAFVAALYVDTWQSDDEQLKLGRATAWSDAAGPVRGAGLRMYLVGDQDRSIFEISGLEFGANG